MFTYSWLSVQSEHTAHPRHNIQVKDNGNLALPISEAFPSYVLLCCPIFHNNTFFQG